MGPKKPKKTKAELEEEKAAREEEERKAKLAEEKRIAEEQEKQRLEEERIRAEYKDKRKQELERLSVQYAEIDDAKRSREAQLIAEQKREMESLEWLRYREPSDEPDAAVDKDMNTFITQMQHNSTPEIRPTMDVIMHIEKIASAVEDVWSESFATGNYNAQAQALRNLEALQQIMYDKLDAATAHLMRFVDKHLNDRTEVNIEELANKLSFGIWSSLSDMRPNRKSVQLESMGLQVDIPKQILQQHEKYVFRFIRMPTVTYNLKAYEPSSLDNISNTGAVQPVSRGDAAAAAPSAADLRHASRYVVGDLVSFDILYSAPAPYQIRSRRWTIRDHSEAAAKIRKAAYPSSVACRMFLKVPADVVMSDDMRVAVWDEEARDWTEDGITDFKYSEETRTVQFYVTTVGTLALVKSRVADMPFKHWQLQPVLDKDVNALLVNRLREIDFPEEASSKAASRATSARAGAGAEANYGAEDEAAAVGVDGEATLTGGGEAPEAGAAAEKKEENPDQGADTEGGEEKVAEGAQQETSVSGEGKGEAGTDAGAGAGEASGPSDEQKGPDGGDTSGGDRASAEGDKADGLGGNSNKGSSSSKRGTSARQRKGLGLSVGLENAGVIISKKTGQPEQHCRFTLQTQHHEVTIDVVGSACILVRPEGATFEELVGREMSPGSLLLRLQRKGINLLPTEADLQVVDGCTPKNAEMEQQVLAEVSRGASALQFGSSPWNQTLSASQIGLHTKEATAYACFTEANEYECVLAELDHVSISYQNTPELGISPGPGGLKYTLVFGNEYGTRKKFSHAPRPDEIPHLELVRVLVKRATAECSARMQRTNERFNKTVLTLLILLRPYSLC